LQGQPVRPRDDIRPPQPTHYVAKACSAFDRDERVDGYVAAVIDYRARILHMTVR
jgi:hypothetical protein